MSHSIAASLMRGGTSRGVLFRASDLPSDEAQRLEIFRYALGSPDPSGRQVDGLGGGNASTSKAAVVAPSTRSDCDVDYSFYQVGVADSAVDTRGNCGNLTAAVAAFAVDEGWVPAADSSTQVRIFNTNTQRRIVATVPVAGGKAQVAGDFRMSGVPRPGAPIQLVFEQPGGAVTGKLLPTGVAQERFTIPSGREVRVSIVDAANPVVLVAAEDLGVPAAMLPPAIEEDKVLLENLEAVRGQAAVGLGLAKSAAEAKQMSATLPFVGFVGRSSDHEILGGDRIQSADASLIVRYLSGGTPHRALPLTAALACAIAAGVDGTLAAESCSGGTATSKVRLAHPSGILEIDICVRNRGSDAIAESAAVTLTARKIMTGSVLLSNG